VDYKVKFALYDVGLLQDRIRMIVLAWQQLHRHLETHEVVKPFSLTVYKHLIDAQAEMNQVELELRTCGWEQDDDLVETIGGILIEGMSKEAIDRGLRAQGIDPEATAKRILDAVEKALASIRTG